MCSHGFLRLSFSVRPVFGFIFCYYFLQNSRRKYLIMINVYKVNHLDLLLGFLFFPEAS